MVEFTPKIISLPFGHTWATGFHEIWKNSLLRNERSKVKDKLVVDESHIGGHIGNVWNQLGYGLWRNCGKTTGAERKVKGQEYVFLDENNIKIQIANVWNQLGHGLWRN